MKPDPKKPVGSWLARAGLRLSDFFERWFPDAFALALAAVAIVFGASLAIGNSPVETAQWFGAGFWDLVTFTVHAPVVLFLVWILNYTLRYTPPVVP